MPNIGFQELLIIAVIALLVFGAKRLPEMGAAFGKGIREFKRSLKDVQDNIDASSEQRLPGAGQGRQIDETSQRSGDPKKLSQ